MAPTTNFSLRFWLIALGSLGLLLWVFKPVLFPFLAGIAVAYFLEPAVSALEARKVPRWLGSSLVLASFVLLVVLVFLLLWPMISSQIAALLYALPEALDRARETYLPWAQNWLSKFSPDYIEKIEAAATQSTNEAVGWISQAVRSLISSGVAVIDTLAISILAPITAFYVLRDWKKMVRVIDSLIPRRPYATIRAQMDEINETLSGFMRGQAIVCVILGIFYSVGLVLNDLQYGATVGLVAGILTIVPYVGTIFGWVTSVLLAAVQFEGDWLRIGLVFGVFLVGQFLEGYILTPRLVGNRVGLHPVWILFALIAGVKLLGFTGALIAVPTAAVIGVLARFGAKYYKSSSIYAK